MKQRDGFVSNSSSSSFLVVIDPFPGSPEELAVRLGMYRLYISPFDYNENWPVIDVAKRLWSMLSGSEPLGLEQVARSLELGYFVGVDFGEGELPDKNEERNLIILEMAKAWMNDPRVKGKDVYKITISDNDGPMDAAMEHGNLFENFMHLKIGHH